MTDATGGPDPEWANEEQDRLWFGDGEHGFWQLLPPGPMPERRELSEEEQREATTRYLKARFTGRVESPAEFDNWAQDDAALSLEEPWVDPDVIRGIERVTGETYRLGRWYQEPAAVDEYPEGERDE